MSLRTGYTTGACAAAAAKAAVTLLLKGAVDETVRICLPREQMLTLRLEDSGVAHGSAWAAIKKDAGDDPDVTDGCVVHVHVEWLPGGCVEFVAGPGVGTVTKPGLALQPGEPAINPVPRKIIQENIRAVTDQGVRVTVSIPGGEELATKTFNPRLGVVDGLSILGTSGIVRPFSAAALEDALRCALDVARACGVRYPILVPGRIGEKAASAMFVFPPEQLIEVSNAWGFMLDLANSLDFEGLLVVGHPGKLAKLAAGWWDTHSSKSDSAVPFVREFYTKLFADEALEALTVEGLFNDIPEERRHTLADGLAEEIRSAVRLRVNDKYPVSVALINLQSKLLGSAGDLTCWKARP